MLNNKPLLSVLTRTHLAEEYFKVCRQSVMSQTYENLNHVVGSDTECSYFPAIPLQSHAAPVSPQLPFGTYPAPHNLCLNELHTHVKDGWVMYLDEDDKFTTPKSVSRIMDRIDNDSQLIIWKVDIKGYTVVPTARTFGKYIQAGDISGIGICFHSKHLPVDWGDWSYGDFRVCSQLIKKGLKPKWIDMVLTETQGVPRHGKNIDK
jgi:hypothetical protein